MTKSKELQFKIGSRVMHKPAVMMGSRGALPPRLRFGIVEDIQYRSNKRGSQMPWLLIKWDGSMRSEWHMTMRIALAPNKETIDKVVANEREKVN